MKYCRKCGAGVSDDAAFCTNCGEEVEQANEVVSAEVVSIESYGVKERSLVTAILLSIITCGLYTIYWQVKVNDEALELANEKGPSGVMVILLSIITCGLYGYFWVYKMGVCSDKMKGNPNGNTGILYVVIALLGLSIVDLALTQDAINSKVNVG